MTVIDLVAIGNACEPMVRCYESWTSGDDPSVRELEAARRSLLVVDNAPGRLGQAISAIVSGGTNASTEATLADLAFLRRVTTISRHSPAAGTGTLRSALHRLSSGLPAFKATDERNPDSETDQGEQ